MSNKIYLVECTKEHNADKCGQCAKFLCEKIGSMLEKAFFELPKETDYQVGVYGRMRADHILYRNGCNHHYAGIVCYNEIKQLME